VRILLLGANGQVGWELRRTLATLGPVVACDRDRANLEDLRGLRTLVREVGPEVIVNAAAHTAVDRAESEPERANLVNADAVALMAEESCRLGAWLVHYSTDYVFDGTSPRPYLETDEPNPQSVYGRSKLAGERAIQDSGCRYLIFRTSWVYAARGANFARTMLGLAREKDSLQVVADQLGAPTSAALISDVTSLCLYRMISLPDPAGSQAGIYHLSPDGETSWYDYARHVIGFAEAAGVPLRAGPGDVTPVTTEEFSRPAPRPANSRLDTRKLRQTFGITLPHWHDHLDLVLRELITQAQQ